MKIALLTFEYPPETGASDAGLYAYHHARALARLGHEVHVFAGAPARADRTAWDGTVAVRRFHRDGPVQKLGTRLSELGLPGLGERIARGADTLAALRAELRQQRFDIVEVSAAGGEAPLLALQPAPATVVRLDTAPRRDGGHTALDRVLTRAVESIGIEAATAVSASSQWLLDQVRQRVRLQRPAVVIPNGIDLSLFDEAAPVDLDRLGIHDGRFHVLCPDAASDPWARGVLRELVLDFAEQYEHVTFVLTGGCEATRALASELRATLEERGQTQALLALSNLEPAEHRALQKSPGAVLLVSRHQSCPRACLEAMAARRAIVAWSSGGVPEIVRAGSDGLLAPHGDDAQLREHLLAVIGNESLRLELGRNARQRIETSYAIDAVAERSAEFYTFVAGAAPRQHIASRDPARLFGPQDWFEAWWLARTPRLTPAMALSPTGEAAFAELSLDELRFVDSILTTSWLEEHGDRTTPEWRYLQQVHELYLDRAARSKEAGSTSTDDALRLALPPLTHPLFEEGRARWFIDELWRIQKRAGFAAWLTHEISAPWFAGEAALRVGLRRLAIVAVYAQPSPETYAVLRRIYRAPATHERTVQQDREFFTGNYRGPELQRVVQDLGLHAPLRRPPVFPVRRRRKKPRAAATPQVTVLIPSFKHEKFIAAAIHSVLAQSFPDLQVLVVDDRSPDGTVAAARRVADPRITVRVNEENLGLGNSIRAALASITTPYVAVLNSDDLFHPERLARCLEVLEADASADIVATGLQFTDKHGRELTRATSCIVDVGPRAHSWLYWYDAVAKELKHPSDWTDFAQLLRHNHLATSSNMVMRTRFLRDHIAAAAPLKYCVDWMLFLIAAGEGSLRFVPEPLLAYRFHEHNTVWFEQGGRADYVLEVNGVVSHVLRRFWRQRVREAGAEKAREELAALLEKHVARHGETDGFALYLTEMSKRVADRADTGPGSALEEFTEGAMVRKTSTMVMERIDLPPWDLVEMSRQQGRHRMDEHVAEAFLSQSRHQAAELEAMRRRMADDAVRQEKIDRQREAEMQRMARETELAIQQREQAERDAAEWRRERNVARNQQASLEQARSALANEVQRLRDEIAAERGSTREALDALDEERSAHERDVQKLTMRLREQRREHEQRLRRITHTHEWRVGRLLLRKMHLMGVWKTALRGYVHAAVRGGRILARLSSGRSSAGKGRRVVVTCGGPFPTHGVDPAAWETRSLLASGFDVRLLCWGAGPKELLREPDRGLLRKRHRLHLDDRLQRADRSWFEKRMPKETQELLALHARRPDLLAKLFTAARSARALGAGYLHGLGIGDSALLAHGAARLLGLPYGVALTGRDVAAILDDPRTAGVVVRGAAVVVTDCQHTADALAAALAERLGSVIAKPPAVYWEHTAAPASWNGRLHAAVAPSMPSADVLMLPDAVKVAVERGADLRVDLPGGADAKDAFELLRLRVQELGLQDRFSIRHEEDTASFEQLLESSSLLVATSHAESPRDATGLPGDVLTAMAAGLPIVASRGSALEDVVRDGEDGLLVQADDPSDLAAALERLADDPELCRRLGAGARARFLSAYSPDVSAADLRRRLAALLAT
jgi:glycosyltransferase involved in cell wall biosynthesis